MTGCSKIGDAIKVVATAMITSTANSSAVMMPLCNPILIATRY